jgi:hypothetical protein
MEVIADSTEQVYVRPTKTILPATLKGTSVPTVYVPSMTGLISTAEPVYQRPKLDQLLGQGRPGDIIRNLLVEAHQSETAWPALTEGIRRLFGYELLPPDASMADIRAEYRVGTRPALDIASAGSGFQQVLMLLAFLHTRPASVLLLDEPDAHLHVILQDAIYGELRSVAARQNSKLIIATHSEAIIDSVAPEELCVLLGQPRLLRERVERTRLRDAMRTLTNQDIMLAQEAPGILYVEDKTDLSILTEWATILGHPIHEVLTTRLFWKKVVSQIRDGAEGLQARDHYETLKLVRDDLPGLELLDGDAHPEKASSAITGHGLQRLRWRRYEIESYLLHPDALERYVRKVVGAAADPAVADMRKYFEDNFPPAVVRDPLGDHEFLNTTKARTKLLPPLLDAAGLQGLPYTRYHEIAALMNPEEIHPEVRGKLDAIQKAFRL